MVLIITSSFACFCARMSAFSMVLLCWWVGVRKEGGRGGLLVAYCHHHTTQEALQFTSSGIESRDVPEDPIADNASVDD